MAKQARKRRAWTAEQVRSLKTMARQKKRASRIAERLKRTEGATRQKAFSIGLSLDFAGLSSEKLCSGERGPSTRSVEPPASTNGLGFVARGYGDHRY